MFDTDNLWGGNLQKKVFQNGRCRKLTPLEYERLQTLPDDYTNCVADTHRYNSIGNGWTVEVIAHIFSNLKGMVNEMIKCKQGVGDCGKDMCCKSCEDKDTCEQVCESISIDCDQAYDTETSLQVFKSSAAATIKTIADIVIQKKELEDKEKSMKEQLQKSMEHYGIKSFDNDAIKVTYMAESVRNSVDSAKLKKNYPEIAAECNKTSNVKAFVKIEVK